MAPIDQQPSIAVNLIARFRSIDQRKQAQDAIVEERELRNYAKKTFLSQERRPWTLKNFTCFGIVKS